MREANLKTLAMMSSTSYANPEYIPPAGQHLCEEMVAATASMISCYKMAAQSHFPAKTVEIDARDDLHHDD